MLEPTARVEVEHIVRKSRFIGLGIPASTVESATAEIKQIKHAHSTASHVVHAYLVGAPERELGSLTDAGEPRGTAGRPVMEILRGSDVRNVVIAVVRYFGGTKLGTGGLVHAYGDTARKVLKRLPSRPLVLRDRLSLTIDYARLEPVRRLLAENGAEILTENFETGVRIDLSVDRARTEMIVEMIRDATAGSADIRYQTP